ncbi:MAG: serine/threonine protein kinase [Myxococcales bacterium]|nr:serine/threonine protein kinase [Myxococcales bacterium]MCB9644595.1 serine/threonine protein kinase [Myxococcales bacterium]
MTITIQDLTKDPTSLVGQTIAERYDVQRFVAQGGMAWIYQVYHRALKRTMALKLLFPHLSVDHVVRGRFIGEAEIQFRMQHDGIVRVVELLDDGELLGMVQEWISGPDLKQYLIQGRHLLSSEELRSLLLPLLDALAYAHGEGIIHRDLKPGNVMLAPRGDTHVYTPKLSDFGIAKFLDDMDEKTTTGSILGTFKYTAPEQIKDSKNIDHRVDIYAMGVMMYQLSVGHVPFRGGLQTILYQHMHEVPQHPCEINKRLPQSFGDIVMRCLAKDPSERYSNCRELQEDIAEALPAGGKLYTVEKRNELRLAKKTLQTDNDLTVQLSAEDIVTLKDFDSSSSVEYASEDLVEKKAAPFAPMTPLPHAPIFASQQLADDASHGSRNTYQDFARQGAIHPDDTASVPLTKSSPPWVLIFLGSALLIGMGLFAGIYFSRPSGPNNPLGTLPQLPRNHAPPLAECTDKDTQPCYSGSSGTRGKGPCKGGLQTCVDGKWQPCKGEMIPSKELCNDRDDDCDGKIDEDFAQKGQECYGDLENCKDFGTWACSEQGTILCKTSSKQRNKRTVAIHIEPADVSFKLQHKRYHTIETKKHTCFPLKVRRGNLTLYAPGYALCVLPVRKLRGKIRLKMKKKSFLEENPDYCRY